MLQLKKGAKANITPRFAVALMWVKQEWEKDGLGPFIVTSLKDGRHMKGSDHKQDRPDSVPGVAADIRTWKLWQGPLPEKKPTGKRWKDSGQHNAKLIKFAKKLQKKDFKVVVHPDWVDGTPHLHFALGKAKVFERV
jgi:hypothetical protein